MHKIFFSWQADRSTSACRNIIERALQSAIDRLRTDIDIESAVREELELDKDTQNIPGTPAIFDTIMEKIATARIFVPDLTFIGERADGRPISNPNVLVEYGLALAKPGWARIVTVMNDAYGEPSNTNMPFNLAHTRFPITYTLREDAKEEERNTVRKTLARKLENALRTIFDSPDYLAQTLTMRTRTASDIAALHQGELDYQAELSALHYGDGLASVRGNVENLFRTIERQCLAISNQHEFDLDCGWKFAPSESSGACVVRDSARGIVVRWYQPSLRSLEGAGLSVQEFTGHLKLPHEPFPRVHLEQPSLVNEARYNPSLSREQNREIGWAKIESAQGQSSFLSNDNLSDQCLAQVLNSIRRGFRAAG